MSKAKAKAPPAKKRSRLLENEEPLWKRYPNFDTDERSSDEERTALERFAAASAAFGGGGTITAAISPSPSASGGGGTITAAISPSASAGGGGEIIKKVEEGVAFASQKQKQKQMSSFAQLLEKRRQEKAAAEAAEMKARDLSLYTVGFIKYELYLQNYAADGEKLPPALAPATDTPELAKDKQEIIQAYNDYVKFKQLMPGCKQKLFDMIHSKLTDVKLQKFHNEMKQAKELHVGVKPLTLILKTALGHEKLNLKSENLQQLFIAAHSVYYFEQYVWFMLDQLLTGMAKQIDGKSFCYTWSMLAAVERQFVPIISNAFAFINL
jgi:hypothetical protein